MILLWGLCIAVLVWDVLFLRVPNRLLLLALAIHLVFLLITGHGIDGIDVWQSLLGGTVGLVLFAPLYVWRAMGAGDVKFFALLGLLLGAKYLLLLWLIASVLAGVHAMIFHLCRRELPLVWMAPPGLHRLFQRVGDNATYRRILRGRQGRKGIPYAAYLAAAAMFTVLQGQ